MAEDRRRPRRLDSELFGVTLGAKGFVEVAAAEATPTKAVASAIFMVVIFVNVAGSIEGRVGFRRSRGFVWGVALSCRHEICYVFQSQFAKNGLHFLSLSFEKGLLCSL